MKSPVGPHRVINWCSFNSPNFNSPNSNYMVRVRDRVRVRVRVRDSVRRIEIRRIEKEPINLSLFNL